MSLPSPHPPPLSLPPPSVCLQASGALCTAGELSLPIWAAWHSGLTRIDSTPLVATDTHAHGHSHLPVQIKCTYTQALTCMGFLMFSAEAVYILCKCLISIIYKNFSSINTSKLKLFWSLQNTASSTEAGVCLVVMETDLLMSKCTSFHYFIHSPLRT